MTRRPHRVKPMTKVRAAAHLRDIWLQALHAGSIKLDQNYMRVYLSRIKQTFLKVNAPKRLFKRKPKCERKMFLPRFIQERF